MVSSESPDPSRLDRAFEVLSDAQRRRLVCYLIESTDGSSTVEELCDVLDGDSRHIETRLRHVHLPRLEAMSIIDYDERTGAIRYSNNVILEDVLDCCARYCDPIDG
ncbi:hypothetical protein [Haladaptatus sp. DYF46]|uniref:DUF7344 domain-containing protein n=1 Tax=Haladaptatus sp. DYF46 TaxID=2886041 RepID=UPI001E31BFAC|nr:hypothetical protein [Haladaptatus sp. DYF46]